MSTLLQLLLWMIMTATVGMVVAFLTVRWAARRVRSRLAARLSVRFPTIGWRGPALATSMTEAASSAADSITAPARVRVRAKVPGPGRQVAAVRRDLLGDLAGVKRAVAAGRDAGRPVAGLDSVVRRLTEQARQLDVDLVVVAAEPDALERRRLLAGQADRVALLHRAYADVRLGVLLAGSTSSVPLLTSMVADLNDEIVGLGLQAQAYQELSNR
jgi:hypothetical protein